MSIDTVAPFACPIHDRGTVLRAVVLVLSLLILLLSAYGYLAGVTY